MHFLGRGVALSSAFPFLSSGAPASGRTTHASSPPGPNPALRILPVGDSLTLGFQSPDLNGYRLVLQQALAPVCNATFVGTQHGGNMSNNAHEGYNAQAISSIQNLSHTAVSTLKPDVVLLLAGTNDLFANVLHQPFEQAPARLNKLVQNISETVPNATVIVAQIINTADPAAEKRILTFNAEVPKIVEKFQQAGKKVGIVDLQSVKAKDLVDGVHPNAKAYRHIGELWFKAMRRAAKEGILDVLELKF